MSDDPLVTPDDLALVLNDQNINVPRAMYIINYVQTLCEMIVSPLPANAWVVVSRVSAAGYAATMSSRQKQLADAGSPFGFGAALPTLSDQDEADLRNLDGQSGGAFTISMLPADYAPLLPPWDLSSAGDGWGSTFDWPGYSS